MSKSGSDQQPCYLRRTQEGFAPADTASEDLIQNHPIGSTVNATFKQPRSLAHHQRYWAMINIVSKALPNPVPANTLHQLIKLRTGHFTPVQTRQGLETIPGSISFSQMDQGQFNAFFKQAMEYLCTEVLPVTQKELRNEVEAALLGIEHDQR